MTTTYTDNASVLSTSISDILTTSYDDGPSDVNGLHDLQDSNSASTMHVSSTQSPAILTKDNADKVQTYVIVAVGLLFNFTALVVYTKAGCNRRRTTPVMLITTLAWMDCLAILSYIGRSGLKPLIRDDQPQVYCNIFGFITNFYPFASGFIVMLMSVERYTALVTPYRYHRRFTKFRTTGAVLFLVCAAALIGALPFFGVGSYQRVYKSSLLFLSISCL